MWKPRLIKDARMKYLGIVEALEADVRSGRVARGDRLPSQRAIAEALGVDLTTVTRAFTEARRRGFVTGHAGRGTFITEVAHSDSVELAPHLIDFSMNIPPHPLGMDFRTLFSQGVADVLSAPRGLLQLHYQESTGAEPDRHAAANWLSSWIENLSAERVVVTGGGQSALFALCELLLERGDGIAAGAMIYPGLKAVAIQKGLQLHPLVMDAQGIVPDAFERLCVESAPKALYVVPNIDNPTTATLSEERRRALVKIARQYNVVIIEDDPHAPLMPERRTAMAELAADITWHIATLSKCVTPALRLAYVVAPDANWALRLAGVLRATIMMAPPLMTGLASRWIGEGVLNELTRSIRQENMERQKIAASILNGFSFAADPHGQHVWLQLPEHWRAAEFAGHAERAGVSIVPSSVFATVAHPIEAVRISLGVATDRSELEDGLNVLSNLISQPSLGAKVVV